MRNDIETNNRDYLSSDAKKFASEMNEARQISKVPELFRCSSISGDKLDEIRILRRWNSHTPSLWDVPGGGYFIRWNGRGTVVDPGCSFIKLLQTETFYKINDIDMVIATHDHLDHCQDFGTFITLFREYNKWLDSQNRPSRTWDLLMSLGVADQFTSLLVHPENAPFLRWNRVLSPDIVEQVQPLHSIAQKLLRKLWGWKKHLSTYSAFCQSKIVEDYGYNLTILPARHTELLGGKTALGIQFELVSSGKTIVISGDTGFDEKFSPVQSYNNADILILHVGTMEGVDGKPLKEHLGLKGVTNILASLKTDKLKIVILTEWGYEFGRLVKAGDLAGRTRFTELVCKRLHDMACDRYFAAISDPKDQAIEGKIPIIPADIGLRVRLPDFYIWASDPNGGNSRFSPLDKIWAEENGDEIKYYSR